jgi:hypothetical protein
MYYYLRTIKEDKVIISIFSLMVITLLLGIMTNSNYFSTVHFAYGQASQTHL